MGALLTTRLEKGQLLPMTCKGVLRPPEIVVLQIFRRFSIHVGFEELHAVNIFGWTDSNGLPAMRRR